MRKDPNRKAYLLVTLKLWRCKTEKKRKDRIKEMVESIRELGLYGSDCIEPTKVKEFELEEKP